MVERRSGSGIASFFVEAAPVAGGVMALPDAAVKHARVRRLTVGDAARVTDGGGGSETVWLDSPAESRFLRVQGVRRATRYGYSLYGIQAYATAG